MEEIITVDGRQFKLTTDRPLTAEQKAQTIAEIRKQTGCGTCGTRSLDPNWGYGGIRTLAPSCGVTQVSGGQAITLNAAPMAGTALYTVTFHKQLGCTVSQIGTTQTGIAEATTSTVPTTTPYTYTILDSDIVASGAACTLTPAIPGAITGSTLTVPAKAANTFRVITYTTDSCPTGARECVEYCDMAVVCPAPTCNFIVT